MTNEPSFSQAPLRAGASLSHLQGGRGIEGEGGDPVRTSEQPRRPASAEAGFTLIEVLVSLAVMVVVLIGLLSILQLNSRVAKAQVNVADMQQSLRVAQAEMIRDVRKAGRGGLPAFRPASGAYPGMFLPQGVAIAVDNNVAEGTTIDGDAGPTVLAGTDVLTVRGVLTTTLYQVNPTEDGRVTFDGAGIGSIIVRDPSPTGVPQSLDGLRAAVADGRPEALLLVSTLADQIQAVVQLTTGQDVEGGYQLRFTTTGTHGTAYSELSPGGEFPAELLGGVAAVGILEEYRYYVRDEPPAPRLSRAQFYPGTNTAYASEAGGAGTANLAVDVADNILDLQVALGIARSSPDKLEDDGNETDDWLFNAPGDSPIDSTNDWNDPDWPLYYLRITTLARTDRIDLKYVSPPIQAIEDRVYDEPEIPAEADRLARSYRRRLLQTVVDMRNL